MYLTLEDLSQLVILRAVFTLAFVLVSMIVGIRILSKYFAYKKKELITVGLTWIFISSAWWPLAFTFLGILLFNYALEPTVYLYLMTAFIPLALISWVYSFANLVYPSKKEKIIYPFLILCIVYLLAYHILLILDPNNIAAYKGGFEYQRSLMVNLFSVFTLVVAVITGIIFTRTSLKSPNATVQWKGRFLILGILSFVVGALLDIFSTGNPVLQTTVRIILIIASIEYYLGFFLPDKVAELLIKEE